jgi:hypothetical protein
MSTQALAPPARGLAFAALGPVAIGGIVATRAEVITPLFSTPAILFGVIAATSPALYIALAATGDAPPLAKVVRAFGVGLAAFGVVLAGLILPVAFLAASSVAPATTFVVASVALGGAALLAFVRLARELATDDRALMPSIVFFVWAAATAGIAGRLWIDLVQEVMP